MLGLVGSNFEREARLAHARRAGDGDQSTLGQCVAYHSLLFDPADQLEIASGQVPLCARHGAQGGNSVCSPSTVSW